MKALVQGFSVKGSEFSVQRLGLRVEGFRVNRVPTLMVQVTDMLGLGPVLV